MFRKVLERFRVVSLTPAQAFLCLSFFTTTKLPKLPKLPTQHQHVPIDMMTGNIMALRAQILGKLLSSLTLPHR
jgi:hypothetical protein